MASCCILLCAVAYLSHCLWRPYIRLEVTAQSCSIILKITKTHRQYRKEKKHSHHLRCCSYHEQWHWSSLPCTKTSKQLISCPRSSPCSVSHYHPLLATDSFCRWQEEKSYICPIIYSSTGVLFHWHWFPFVSTNTSFVNTLLRKAKPSGPLHFILLW